MKCARKREDEWFRSEALREIAEGMEKEG